MIRPTDGAFSGSALHAYERYGKIALTSRPWNFKMPQSLPYLQADVPCVLAGSGTGDIFEIEIAGADKIAETARGFCS